MDISKVTNQEAKRFLNIFLLYRSVNREFYELVPEDKFDFRMVDTEDKKSDSPRESLAHQINVQNSYMQNILNGISKFGTNNDGTLKLKSKQELLKILDETDQKLIEFLSDENNLQKKVAVKWSKTPISAMVYIWGLNDHEIFHNGWNIALMDHLNIPRFNTLQQVWG